MHPWNSRCTKIATTKFRSLPHQQIAKELDKSPKAVARWLRSKGLLKMPNYTEMELYILEHFPAEMCAPFIPHKSLNALKIKQCRIKQSTRACRSTR